MHLHVSPINIFWVPGELGLCLSMFVFLLLNKLQGNKLCSVCCRFSSTWSAVWNILCAQERFWKVRKLSIYWNIPLFCKILVSQNNVYVPCTLQWWILICLVTYNGMSDIKQTLGEHFIHLWITSLLGCKLNKLNLYCLILQGELEICVRNFPK